MQDAKPSAVVADGTAYLSTLSRSDKREGLANIEAKGHIK